MLLAILLFFSTILIGQIKTKDTVVTLIPVTIKSTRIAKSILLIPVSVTTIDQKQIQQGSQQLSAKEVFKYSPGVFVQNAENMAQDLRIAIRGFGARASFGIRGVRILSDFIPESTPDGQAQIDNLDMGMISNVEVFRGAAAGIYGNASGGVIRFESEKVKKSFAELRMSSGSYDFGKYQFKGGYAAKNFDMLGYVSHTKLLGYRKHNKSENTLYNLNLNYQPTKKSEIKAILNYLYSPIALDPGGITLEDLEEDPEQAREKNILYNAGESVKQLKTGVQYIVNVNEKSTIKAKTFFISRMFDGKIPTNGNGGGVIDLDRTFWGIGAHYKYDNKNVKLPYQLVLGVDYQNQKDHRRRFKNKDGVAGDLGLDQDEIFINKAVFLEQDITFLDKITAVLKLRYDANTIKSTDYFLSNGDASGEISLNSFNPMLGLTYSFSESLNLFAKYATSFETPTLQEFSANPNNNGGFNLELKPQEATSFELGIKGIVNQRMFYELSLFSINLKNELVPYEIDGGDYFRNAGESKRNGIEFGLTVKAKKYITANINMTYSDFTFTDFVVDNTSYNNNFLPGIPKITGALNIAYQGLNGFYANINSEYVSSIFTDNKNAVEAAAYTLVGLNLGKIINVSKITVEPFIGLNNLLNESYSSNIRINAFGKRYYEPGPTINFYIGGRIRI